VSLAFVLKSPLVLILTLGLLLTALLAEFFVEEFAKLIVIPILFALAVIAIKSR